MRPFIRVKFLLVIWNFYFDSSQTTCSVNVILHLKISIQINTKLILIEACNQLNRGLFVSTSLLFRQSIALFLD
jgi:hypothetical protein